MNHILQLLVRGFYCPQLNLSWRKTNEIISHPSRKGAGRSHWAGSTSPSCWESATAIGGTSGGDWTNWRMEICVTNGLHWNHWSGNWSRSCWNFCWEIWKLLNGDPIFNLWSLYVFVQISCLIIQSFSEQKDLQNKGPMVALCAGWYGLRCSWWFLGRSQGGWVVFFGAQAWFPARCARQSRMDMWCFWTMPSKRCLGLAWVTWANRWIFWITYMKDKWR